MLEPSADLRTVEYVSTATKLYDGDALLHLLDRAAGYNVDVGVTGLLLFGSGVFVQTIEGLDKDVQSVFERIKSDASHKILRVFANEPITCRVYTDWAMMANFVAPSAPIVAHLESCRVSLETKLTKFQVAALNRAIEFLKQGHLAQ